MPTTAHDDKNDDSADLLRLAQKRFSNLLRSLPIGVAIVRGDGTIEAVNAAILKLFGYPETALAGQSIAFFMRKPPWPPGSNFRDWYKDNSGRTIEVEGWTADDQVVPIDLIIQPLESDGQERLIVAVQDVTDRFIANKLKSDFYQMINHDIRSPLSSVVLFLKSLESDHQCGTVTALGWERLKVAERNVDRILNLVDGLLQLEKITDNPAAFQKSPINLSDLLRNSVALIVESASAKDIAIEVSSSDNIEISGTYARLEQLLVNLLSNGVAYSSSGQPLKVSAKRQHGYVRVSIEDSGPGIQESERSTIFDKFKQGVDSRKGGFGLGLAISKEIVLQHDGRIGCEAAAGGGTVFWFEIPAG